MMIAFVFVKTLLGSIYLLHRLESQSSIYDSRIHALNSIIQSLYHSIISLKYFPYLANMFFIINSLIPLGFLVIGFIFIGSLFYSVFRLLDFKWDQDGSNFKALVTLFRIPLISFLFLLIFIFFIVPALEG